MDRLVLERLARRGQRKTALQETEAAIALARHLPYRHLVVHLGMPTTERVAAHDNQPELARRSVEEIVEKAAATTSASRSK